jgi:pimeloyl-ACP methyl ester carboxylesterase
MERIDLSQGAVAYRDEGQGPPVLFVHGLLVDGALWRGVADRLARTHRCIVPDWPLGSHRIPLPPGAERTPAGVARMVAELMGRLDLRDVTLVGNDTGGAIAQLVAADHGERLGRLVLTDCDAFEVFPPRGFAHLTLAPRVPGLLALLMKSMRRVPALRRLPLAYGALARRPIPQETLRRWVEPAARDPRVRHDLARFLRAVEPSVTLDVAERLPRFGRPVLLLWSREDRYFPLDLAKRLQQTFPVAEIRELTDALTFSPLDQPRRVAEEIADFVSASTGSRIPPAVG